MGTLSQSLARELVQSKTTHVGEITMYSTPEYNKLGTQPRLFTHAFSLRINATKVSRYTSSLKNGNTPFTTDHCGGNLSVLVFGFGNNFLAIFLLLSCF